MNILLRIRELCDDKGISVRKLERDLDLGNRTIDNWNTSSPSIEKIQKVANYFGVSINHLVSDEEEDDDLTVEIRKRCKENEAYRMLFDATRNCSAEQIKAVAEMVNAWKK